MGTKDQGNILRSSSEISSKRSGADSNFDFAYSVLHVLEYTIFMQDSSMFQQSLSVLHLQGVAVPIIHVSSASTFFSAHVDFIQFSRCFLFVFSEGEVLPPF